MLIGFPKVPLLQLRIKDNADHAGLSLLPEDSKVLANSLMELLRASQNNNSLTAQENTETKPATEVLWTTPSNSSRTTELFMKINILTKLSNKPAQRLEDHSRFQDSLISRTVTIWPQPSPEDPSQLLLMPQIGLPIKTEFSAAAKLN
jgi:hypothetical protein